MLQQNESPIILLKVSFLLLTVYFCFSLTVINNTGMVFRSICLLGVLLMFLGFFLYAEIRINHLFVLVPIVIIMLFSFLYFQLSGHNNQGEADFVLLYSIIFMICAVNVDVRSLIKVSFYVKLFIFCFTSILYNLNIIESKIGYREGKVRESLGFSNANSLGLIVMCLTIEFIYLYIKKINLLGFFILILINVYVYQISLSRTSFFCSMLMIVFSLIYKYTPFLKSKIIQFSLLLAVPIIFYLGIFLPYAYNRNDKILLWLDDLFSGRLIMGHYYINEYGFSLFGTTIKQRLFVSNYHDPFLIDNTYLRIMIQFGVILFFILFIALLFKCIQFVKMNYMMELCIVLVCLVYSLFESMTYNIFLYSSSLILIVNSKNNMLEYRENNNNCNGIS